MKCSDCGTELTEDMLISGICFNCGCSIIYSKTEAKKELLERQQQQLVEHEHQAEQKHHEYMQKFNNHKLTTSYSFEGYTISHYLGLVSGESVIGAGIISHLEANITNALGIETCGYSEKIKSAKQLALEDMISQSISIGGNAIIGISYSFSNFMSNMIGVSVDGTSVYIKTPKK